MYNVYYIVKSQSLLSITSCEEKLLTDKGRLLGGSEGWGEEGGSKGGGEEGGSEGGGDE